MVLIMLKIGDCLTKSFIVTENMLACNVGSGMLSVLSTPSLIACMENTAAELIQKDMEHGCTTVGTHLNIQHNAPTVNGGEISVTAVITDINGRKYSFSLSAKDAAGDIGSGTHDRFMVMSDKFMEKAKERQSE